MYIQLSVVAGMDIAFLAFTPDSALKLAGYSRIPLMVGTLIAVTGLAINMFLVLWIEDVYNLEVSLPLLLVLCEG